MRQRVPQGAYSFSSAVMRALRTRADISHEADILHVGFERESSAPRSASDAQRRAQFSQKCAAARSLAPVACRVSPT